MTVFTYLLPLCALVASVFAEQHTVRFDNQCGFGTPHLYKAGNLLSTGQDYTVDGPFTSAIAYLQTGDCNTNGEGCTLIETSLLNPDCPGCGSSSDISLIPPLKFSVPASFSYYGGCENQGATCTSANCNTAFFVPDDNQVQVGCQAEDVNLLITFCPGGLGASGSTSSTSQDATVPAAATNIALPTSTSVSADSSTESATSTSATPSSTKCSRSRAVRRRAVRRHAEAIQARKVHQRAMHGDTSSH